MSVGYLDATFKGYEQADGSIIDKQEQQIDNLKMELSEAVKVKDIRDLRVELADQKGPKHIRCSF